MGGTWVSWDEAAEFGSLSCGPQTDVINGRMDQSPGIGCEVKARGKQTLLYCLWVGFLLFFPHLRLEQITYCVQCLFWTSLKERSEKKSRDARKEKLEILVE